MENNLKTYYRDCLFGALGAMLMFVGDLCLSVIPASQTDSGLFLREAYLNGSWGDWRLPLLLATGLCGMALGFFTVRVSLYQIQPQYRKTRLAVLTGGVIYFATAGTGQVPRSTCASTRSFNARLRFSEMPPPVMWASARTAPGHAFSVPSTCFT